MTGAVRTEEARDVTGTNIEDQVANGALVAVGHGEVVAFNH